MKTSYLRATLALALFAGLNLSANAGVLRQDVTPAARLGSSPLPGLNAGPSVIATPTPAQLLPIESPPEATQRPQQPQSVPVQVPMADPAAVPEPGTVGTLAFGLLLMGAIARRRSAARA